MQPVGECLDRGVVVLGLYVNWFWFLLEITRTRAALRHLHSQELETNIQLVFQKWELFL